MKRIITALRCFFRALGDPDWAESAIKAAAEKPQSQETEPKQPIQALELLALLQEEARLIDFFQEDIADYDDEQIGAAVRNIHDNCCRVLAEYFQFAPILSGGENEKTTVAAGFNPEAIKLVGKVTGQPPFYGVIRHHGWQATRSKFPPAKNHPAIVAQAEVELTGD